MHRSQPPHTDVTYFIWKSDGDTCRWIDYSMLLDYVLDENAIWPHDASWLSPMGPAARRQDAWPSTPRVRRRNRRARRVRYPCSVPRKRGFAAATQGGTALIGDLHRFKADYLKAMAHPVRIRVLEILRDGEVAVADVQTQVDADVANISQHLAVLRRAGIVTARKTGLNVLYSVRDTEVFTILDALRTVFSHRLDSMQNVLAADQDGQQSAALRSRRPNRRGGRTSEGVHL